jgi:GMP synthase (glutamine-hydrolysing)
MKTAIVVRHVAFEDLGVFAAPLHAAGYDSRVIDPVMLSDGWTPRRPTDLVIVLGGPIGACQSNLYPFLNAECALIEAQLKAGLPVLGVCLGAQLIAHVLGARVYPMGSKEIGWAPVTLTPAGRASPLASLERQSVLHWHGDMFDVPDGADLLASTETCAHQAFRVADNVLGLQFHCEVDAAQIENWLVGHAAELAEAGIDAAALRAGARQHGAALGAAGHELMTRWLGGLNLP